MSKPSAEVAPKHHFHSARNRALYCVFFVAFVLAFGTLGMHWIEGFSWIDSFYFTCMIATGQGPAPNTSLSTPLGKLFTCLLAFLSVGSMVASLGFLFGPFLGKLFKIGVIKIEDEIHLLKNKTLK